MSFASAISDRNQTPGEELANSISHGVGLLASLIGCPFLVITAVRSGDPAFVVGSSIFSATMILLYLASTMYHALPHGKAKRVFNILDHSAIYLLIAGTYTPFMLGVLRGVLGWTILGVIWAMALAGVLLKSCRRMSHPTLSTGLYLLMGWLIVIAIKPLYDGVQLAGVGWLAAGGLAYTAGVGFFATDTRLRYGHFVWHLFVMAGTACHYFTVLWHASGVL